MNSTNLVLTIHCAHYYYYYYGLFLVFKMDYF